jgi:hypothetical protein
MSAAVMVAWGAVYRMRAIGRPRARSGCGRRQGKADIAGKGFGPGTKRANLFLKKYGISPKPFGLLNIPQFHAVGDFGGVLLLHME